METVLPGYFTGPMNTESHAAELDWVPSCGVQLRKAGVRFDAVRMDGCAGRLIAEAMAQMTLGEPGPVVEEVRGRRAVYFLVPVGSTGHRSWPDGVTRLTGEAGRIAFIPVPALSGWTWPLRWRHQPGATGQLVHPLLLRSTLLAWAAGDLGVLAELEENPPAPPIHSGE
ncbi:hypothetical protein EQK42_17090 [Streptomyces albidoflavus]|nr:hypothetical protein EQK42_17090 [Streptomyces albidoflavus]